LPPTPPPPTSPSFIDSPPSYNTNISQVNLHEIIRQQQEQLAAMQAQIQALLVAQGGVGAGGAVTGSNIGPSMEMAKPAIFNGESGKVGGFITACRLYLRMKMRGSYVQRGSADVWKENIMEELKSGEIKYETAEEFFTSLRKEFGGGEEESVKAAELRRME